MSDDHLSVVANISWLLHCRSDGGQAQNHVAIFRYVKLNGRATRLSSMDDDDDYLSDKFLAQTPKSVLVFLSNRLR